MFSFLNPLTHRVFENNKESLLNFTMVMWYINCLAGLVSKTGLFAVTILGGKGYLPRASKIDKRVSI